MKVHFYDVAKPEDPMAVGIMQAIPRAGEAVEIDDVVWEVHNILHLFIPIDDCQVAIYLKAHG